MGAELGQWREWDHEGQLDWDLVQHEPHARLRDTVVELNQLYRAQPALHQLDFDWHGFQWLDRLDADRSVVAFLRRARDESDCLAVVANFTPMTWAAYVLGVPTAGTYRIVFNSDWKHLGGASQDGEPATLEAAEAPCQDQPCSLTLDLPPLALLILRRADDQPA
jgi:1,4-alpha-glucan branching enzyme